MTSSEAIQKALSLCKGQYQEGIINGDYSISGSDLRGNAIKWSSGYCESRNNLLERLNEHDVPFIVAEGKHGRKFLVFGSKEVMSILHLNNLMVDAKAFGTSKIRRKIRMAADRIEKEGTGKWLGGTISHIKRRLYS